jgi:hypothetical protein
VPLVESTAGPAAGGPQSPAGQVPGVVVDELSPSPGAARPNAGPWTAVARTPGVLTDRLRVGGYVSGPSSAFLGPGLAGEQSILKIDGFELGAASSTGYPIGLGVDSSAEIQVSSGALDVESALPGTLIDLLGKRGTNEWRASGRLRGSGGPLVEHRAATHLAPGQTAAVEDVTSNRLRDAGALGLELGGPLRKERLWIWGSLDRDEVRQTVFGGQTVSTLLAGGAGKMNCALSRSTSVVLAWNRGDQRGSGQGAAPERAPETTWERHDRTDVWRLDAAHIFSGFFYLQARAGAVDGDARDVPRGSWQSDIAVDAGGVARGSWFAQSAATRARAAEATANGFWSRGGAEHEARLAGEWRHTGEQSIFAAPGRGLEIAAGEGYRLPAGVDVLSAWRDGDMRSAADRASLRLADTVRWRNLTAALGLRYDDESLANRASTAPASPVDPLLRAVDFAGGHAARWRSVAPRLGLTWAVGGDRRGLLLRTFLGRFTARLGSEIAAQANPAAPAAGWYFFYDPDRNLALDPGEAAHLRFWVPVNFDPRLPGNVTPNSVAAGLRPETTDEAVAGFEATPLRETVVGLYATYRRTSHILERRRFVRDLATGEVVVATAADYVPAGQVYGGGFLAPYFDLRPGLEPTGGTLLVNGDRRQDFVGLTLELNRRLAGGWMAHGHASWQDWRWKLGPRFVRFADPTHAVGGGDIQNEQVVQTGDRFGEAGLYINSRWEFNVDGLVQLPRGFSASANFNGRQGYPLPYFVQVPRARAGPISIQLYDRLDEFRNANLFTLDSRLDKDVELGDWSLTLSLEVFNLLDAGTVLRRQTDLGLTRAHFVDEVLAPRTLRLGLRVAWR